MQWACHNLNVSHCHQDIKYTAHLVYYKAIEIIVFINCVEKFDKLSLAQLLWRYCKVVKPLKD